MSAKQIGALGVVAAILIGIWHFTHRPENPIVPSGGRVPMSFDQFQEDLAKHVVTLLDAKGVTAVVAPAAYPIGTLLRSSGSVPANSNDCLPAPPPGALPAPHLFPSYTLTTDTVLDASMGASAIQGLGEAGVKLQRSGTLQYAIADSEVQLMDDKSVERVTNQGECGKYIADHPGVRLVRGAVLGRITYTVKVDSPATVKAKLAQLGFTITDNPDSSTLSVSDQQKESIIQLLSEFDAVQVPGSDTAPGNGAAPPEAASPPTGDHPTPAPIPAHGPQKRDGRKQTTEIVIAPPPRIQPVQAKRLPKFVPKAVAQEKTGQTPTSAGPHIYVQIDAEDKPASGAKIVSALRQDWPEANVESAVEKIPSSKMPAVAQVRFFNVLDAPVATRALAILRKSYTDAQMVRIGIPSPNGQLEVWLPKIK